MSRLSRRSLFGPPALLLAGCVAGATDPPRPRPALDVAAPSRTETATFALG
jgi:hypothetical protein